jgi:hypothetical protein
VKWAILALILRQIGRPAKILEVSREEAEWTLDVIDGLIDYFIVGPEKDRLRRAGFDKKIQAAGRKPIS